MPRFPGLSQSSTSALALLLLLAPTVDARPSARKSPGAGQPDHHSLSLQLEEGTELQASGEIETKWARELSLGLNPDTELRSLTCDGHDLLDLLKPDKAGRPGWWVFKAPKACRDDEGRVTLSWNYSARREPGEALILDGSRLDIPRVRDLARVDVEARLPRGWSMVSTGPTRVSASGSLLVASEGRVAELVVVAGPFDRTDEVSGDVTLSLHRLRQNSGSQERHASTAASFLARARQSVESLVARLGPLPTAKLEFVEAGAGRRARAGVVLVIPTSLLSSADPRELTGVLASLYWEGRGTPGEAGEDWRPGLAACIADLLGEPEAGRDARRRTAVRLDREGSISLTAEERGRTLFHQLHRKLGTDPFWSSVAALPSEPAVEGATWEDVTRALDNSGHRQHSRIVTSMPTPLVAPQYALEDLVLEDFVLRGTIRQDGGPFLGSADLALTARDGSVSVRSIELTDQSSSFRLELQQDLARAELDPEWLLPRRSSAAELPPSLARSLARGRLIIVYPAPPASPTPAQASILEAYKRIALELAEASGAEAMSEKDIADIEFREESLLILGRSDHSSSVRRIAEEFLEVGIDITRAGSFLVDDRRWSGPRALLATVPQRDNLNSTLSIWVPNSSDCLPHALAMLEFADHSLAIMESGQLVRGEHSWPEPSDTVVKLKDLIPPESPAARMNARVVQLTRPQLEGRTVSSRGEWLATDLIADAMSKAGLRGMTAHGHAQAFSFVVHDLPKPAAALYRRPTGPSLHWPVAPAQYTLPTTELFPAKSGTTYLQELPMIQPIYFAAPRGMVLGGSLESPQLAGLDLEDSILVLTEDAPPSPVGTEDRTAAEQRRLAEYFEMLPEVRRRNGELLLIVQRHQDTPHFRPLTTYPSLHRQVDPQLAVAYESGGDRGVQRELSKLNAKARPKSPVAIYFATSKLLDAMHQAGATSVGDRVFAEHDLDLRFRLVAERVFDRNLLGLVPGRRPATEGVIVVGSHHDGPGYDAQGYVREAASEAAGTALMLELAERLARAPAASAVAFVSFGAEGWGQKGSRLLADGNWPGDWPMAAMVNLHAVGHEGVPVHVIGASRERDLTRVLRDSLSIQGLQVEANSNVGNDVDGSDHWPWVEVGVPSVSLFQAEPGLLETREDRADKIDPDTLARLADGLEEAIRSLALTPPVAGSR